MNDVFSGLTLDFHTIHPILNTSKTLSKLSKTGIQFKNFLKKVIVKYCKMAIFIRAKVTAIVLHSDILTAS